VGNRAEDRREKKAYQKGYFACEEAENRYKYASACWHAWMNGFKAANKSPNKSAQTDCGEAK